MTKKNTEPTPAEVAPAPRKSITKPRGVEFTGDEVAELFGDTPVEYVCDDKTHTIQEVV